MEYCLFPCQSKETSFYERLKSTSDHVFIYEDPVMMSFALLKIPLEELKKKAKEQSVSTGSPNGSVNDLVDERDCLLLLLLNWFKCKIFIVLFCYLWGNTVSHGTPWVRVRKKAHLGGILKNLFFLLSI